MKRKRSRTEHQADILTIDEHVLDDEWVNQPKLYGQYALKAAEARKDFDQAKAQLDVIAAKVSMNIRENPKKYGLDKITEKSIEHCLLITPEHSKAVDDYIQTRYRMDVVNALVSALDQRKRALEKLVDLRLSDYFSEPRPSEASRSSVEEMRQKKAINRGRNPRSKGKQNG